MNMRRKHISLKNEPLLRAIGLKKLHTPLVFDATPGMGKDAFMLASFNCQIVMVERSVVVAALLENGLERASQNEQLKETIAKMKLINADSIEYLKNNELRPDVIYLDPMFPERIKSAKVKKEMQLLQQLLAHELDNNEEKSLLAIAMEKANNRVVVKRPKAAPWLAGKKPSHCIEGKAIRYDVYLTDI